MQTEYTHQKKNELQEQLADSFTYLLVRNLSVDYSTPGQQELRTE